MHYPLQPEKFTCYFPDNLDNYTAILAGICKTCAIEA